LKPESRKAICLPGDLTSESFCQSLISKAVKVIVGPDVLVSVASKQTAVSDIADLTTEQFDGMFKTNVSA